MPFSNVRSELNILNTVEPFMSNPPRSMFDFEFEISRAAFPLLTEMFNSREVYRSVGIVLEDFREKAEEQLTLFSNNEKKEQNEKLGQSLDKLEKKFGRNIVRTGFTNKEVPFKQGFLTSPKDV